MAVLLGVETLVALVVMAAVCITMQEMERGRGSIALPIGAGILVAASAAVGVWISMGDMERQHRGNMNLSISGHHVFDKIAPKVVAKSSAAPPAPTTRPVAPVIFADEGMFPQFLQYLQFMTDADCYATDSFDLRIAGGFGIFGMGQGGEKKQDAPVLLQQERIDFMTEFFKRKTAAELVREQHQVMDAAFAKGRCVYAILTPVQLIDFKRRFISADYQMAELDHWSEPFGIHFADEDPPRGAAVIIAYERARAARLEWLADHPLDSAGTEPHANPTEAALDAPRHPAGGRDEAMTSRAASLVRVRIGGRRRWLRLSFRCVAYWIAEDAFFSIDARKSLDRLIRKK